MPEPEVIEKALKKSAFGRWLLGVSSFIALPLLTWMGNEALDSYRNFTHTVEALNDRLLLLEGNKSSSDALWSAISENREHLTEMRVTHEAEKLHLKWLSENWLLIQTVKNSRTTDKPDEKDPTIILPPPPAPAPLPPAPKVNAKDFREEYEKKHPLPAIQQQQKK
jgi:hypothetical protein